MPRYVAFLRGVLPTNCKMPALKAAFEHAGFTNVKTVLGSGNVIFDARTAPVSTLEKKAEAAMQSQLGRTFYTIIRTQAEVQGLFDRNPFAKAKVPAGAKCVVSFSRTPPVATVKLPISESGATVLAVEGREAFTCYGKTPDGPVFMRLIGQALGKEQTTRTWDTVRKCATA